MQHAGDAAGVVTGFVLSQSAENLRVTTHRRCASASDVPPDYVSSAARQPAMVWSGRTVRGFAFTLRVIAAGLERSRHEAD
jgi:hypothetical protein